MTLQLRSLEQFKRLHDLQSSTVLVEEEHEFFGSLQSIRDRIVSSNDQWTLISHCEDQVNGFKHLDQIPVLNQLAQDYKDRVTVFVISVNKLDLCDDIHHYFFPEYHAIYWPLYQDQTLSNSHSINKYFLSLNKRGDPWRQILYKKFWKDNLLDSSHFSYLCEDEAYGTLFHEPTWELNRKWADEDFIPKFMPELQGPWPNKFRELDHDVLLEKYKSHQSGQFDLENDPTWSADQHLYDTSFCSVILETDVGNELPNISEKTIRSLALAHPTLLLGAQHTLQYLRDLGFDTFDDVFDNSYDQEQESYNRLCKFLNSVDMIKKYSIDELQNIKKSLYSRGMKNRAQLESLNNKMHTKADDLVQDIIQHIN